MSKISLYFHTVKSMKPSQVYFRLKKMSGLKISLGTKVREFNSRDICPLHPIRELDYDAEFLKRFSADDILCDKVTFLHSQHNFSWEERWKCEDQTALWNFNLHYFEYLFALTDAYKRKRNRKYFDKSKTCIISWIHQNPVEKGGDGWSPYTIALRLTVWLEYYSDLETELKEDRTFCQRFIKSVYDQYTYLSNHLEKDLLGNHYFEDLKALGLCAVFFKDEMYLQCVLKELRAQCREQILPDGMHFELSPMYHKIIFEDMLRVAWGLRSAGKEDKEIEDYLQPMLDVAYSLEEGLERVPLFNDGGANVSKSLSSLTKTAEQYFHITPVYKNCFPDSGYYIFKQAEWKMIVDAGQPGPTYIPGHAHCDAMSFELFKNGKPVLVNCGTYAYQCKERKFYRSTAAHNTVSINDIEQSQCWGVFRLAKRSKVKIGDVTDHSIDMEMTDQKGNIVHRFIGLNNAELIVDDKASEKKLTAYIHSLQPINLNEFQLEIKKIGSCSVECNAMIVEQMYSSEYGKKERIPVIIFNADNHIHFKLCLFE